MTKEETILQLENLKEHCESMILGGSMWKKDVAALNIAIKELKKETVFNDLRDGKITLNQAREQFNLPPIEREE